MASTSEQASTADTSDVCDVLVIGGGMAGVEAVKTLEASGVANILWVEARDYVGGRMKSRDF